MPLSLLKISAPTLPPSLGHNEPGIAESISKSLTMNATASQTSSITLTPSINESGSKPHKNGSLRSANRATLVSLKS